MSVILDHQFLSNILEDSIEKCIFTKWRFKWGQPTYLSKAPFYFRSLIWLTRHWSFSHGSLHLQASLYWLLFLLTYRGLKCSSPVYTTSCYFSSCWLGYDPSQITNNSLFPPSGKWGPSRVQETCPFLEHQQCLASQDSGSGALHTNNPPLAAAGEPTPAYLAPSYPALYKADHASFPKPLVSFHLPWEQFLPHSLEDCLEVCLRESSQLALWLSPSCCYLISPGFEGLRKNPSSQGSWLSY